MSITEKCLSFLQEKKWNELGEIVSDELNHPTLNSDPAFEVFQEHLVNEVKRYEKEGEAFEDMLLFLVHLSNYGLYGSKKLKISESCTRQITEYIFSKQKSEKWAYILTSDGQVHEEASAFLEIQREERRKGIDQSKIASSLNLKISEAGELDFSKSIFNSPQEEELYLAAKIVFENSILLPNTALSTIFNSKIIDRLGSEEERKFFFMSTLDLCIVDSESYLPEYFIELDSSYHEDPVQVKKDKMKDNIFKAAGQKLIRIKKIENRDMQIEFELYLKKIKQGSEK